MRNYLPMLMAVASRNTDSYVGKDWYVVNAPENATLGLSMVRPYTQDGVPNGAVVTADYAGYATSSWDAYSTSATYDNNLRKKVVHDLGINPTWTRGVAYSGYDYVYTVDSDNAQSYVLYRPQFTMTSWGATSNLYSLTGAQPPIAIFEHDNLVGNADPRIVVLTRNSSIYSDVYPSGATTWAGSSTYYGGYTIYAAAYNITTKVITAVCAAGRIRYSTDGTSWTAASLGGTVSDLTTIAWSNDWTKCIAIAKNNDVITSTDGITFSLVSTTGLTLAGDAATLIAGTGAGDFVVATAEGEIAYTTDYGVTWTTTTSRFVVDNYYQGTLSNTPITSWIRQDMFNPATLFVSAYGGQVFRVAMTSITVPTAMTEVDAFGQYTSSFSTADVYGLWAKTPGLPSSGPIVYAAGSMGRLMYVYDSGSPNPLSDMTLFNFLRSASYTNVIASSVFAYGGELVVGLTNGSIAYRSSIYASWSISAVPGVAVPIVSIVRRSAYGDYMALAYDGTLCYGTSSGGGLSWSTSTDLKTALPYTSFTNLAATPGGTGYMVSSYLFNTSFSYSPSGNSGSWTTTSLSPSGSPTVAGAWTDFSYVTAPGGAGYMGYWFGYGTPLYSWSPASAWASPESSGTGWSNVGNNLPRQITGMFSFGTAPRVTMAVGTDGTAAISTNPASINGWGSSPGVTGAQYPGGTPAGYYLPPSTVTRTVATTMTVGTSRDVAFVAGSKARLWVSANPSFYP